MSDRYRSTTPPPSQEVQAIIDSFRRPDFRVADMEREGFTDVKAACAGCGRIVVMPLQLLRVRRHVTDNTRLADIGRAYRCAQCGGRQMTTDLPQPCYQLMGSPNDTDRDSPVNRALRAR